MVNKRKKISKRKILGKERTRFSRSVKKLLKERAQINYRLTNEGLISNETTITSLQSGNQIDECTLRDKLASWANENRISTRAINSLLSILNSSGMNSLPKDYRTLLQTPVNVEIKNIAGGEYWFNGLEKSLRVVFSAIDKDLSIELNFNIDGLPISKSSKVTFYPILASVHGKLFLKLVYIQLIIFPNLIVSCNFLKITIKRNEAYTTNSYRNLVWRKQADSIE